MKRGGELKEREGTGGMGMEGEGLETKARKEEVNEGKLKEREGWEVKGREGYEKGRKEKEKEWEE